MGHLNKYYMLDLSPEDKAEFFAKRQKEKEDKEKFLDEEAEKERQRRHELGMDADNVKAKFRKATAMEKLGDLDGASKEVKSALKLDEENADLLKFKEKLDKLQAAQNAKAKKMYGKMFG